MPPTRRPRAHHRVNLYPDAHRQNETVMFSDHYETSRTLLVDTAAQQIWVKITGGRGGNVADVQFSTLEFRRPCCSAGNMKHYHSVSLTV